MAMLRPVRRKAVNEANCLEWCAEVVAWKNREDTTTPPREDPEDAQNSDEKDEKLSLSSIRDLEDGTILIKVLDSIGLGPRSGTSSSSDQRNSTNQRTSSRVSGNTRMLNTAMGRMTYFLKVCREEIGDDSAVVSLVDVFPEIKKPDSLLGTIYSLSETLDPDVWAGPRLGNFRAKRKKRKKSSSDEDQDRPSVRPEVKASSSRFVGRQNRRGVRQSNVPDSSSSEESDGGARPSLRKSRISRVSAKSSSQKHLTPEERSHKVILTSTQEDVARSPAKEDVTSPSTKDAPVGTDPTRLPSNATTETALPTPVPPERIPRESGARESFRPSQRIIRRPGFGSSKGSSSAASGESKSSVHSKDTHPDATPPKVEASPTKENTGPVKGEMNAIGKSNAKPDDARVIAAKTDQKDEDAASGDKKSLELRMYVRDLMENAISEVASNEDKGNFTDEQTVVNPEKCNFASPTLISDGSATHLVLSISPPIPKSATSSGSPQATGQTKTGVHSDVKIEEKCDFMTPTKAKKDDNTQPEQSPGESPGNHGDDSRGKDREMRRLSDDFVSDSIREALNQFFDTSRVLELDDPILTEVEHEDGGKMLEAKILVAPPQIKIESPVEPSKTELPVEPKASEAASQIEPKSMASPLRPSDASPTKYAAISETADARAKQADATDVGNVDGTPKTVETFPPAIVEKNPETTEAANDSPKPETTAETNTDTADVNEVCSSTPDASSKMKTQEKSHSKVGSQHNEFHSPQQLVFHSPLERISGSATKDSSSDGRDLPQMDLPDIDEPVTNAATTNERASNALFESAKESESVKGSALESSDDFQSATGARGVLQPSDGSDAVLDLNQIDVGVFGDLIKPPPELHVPANVIPPSMEDLFNFDNEQVQKESDRINKRNDSMAKTETKIETQAESANDIGRMQHLNTEQAATDILGVEATPKPSDDAVVVNDDGNADDVSKAHDDLEKSKTTTVKCRPQILLGIKNVSTTHLESEPTTSDMSPKNLVAPVVQEAGFELAAGEMLTIRTESTTTGTAPTGKDDIFDLLVQTSPKREPNPTGSESNLAKSEPNSAKNQASTTKREPPKEPVLADLDTLFDDLLNDQPSKQSSKGSNFESKLPAGEIDALFEELLTEGFDIKQSKEA